MNLFQSSQSNASKGDVDAARPALSRYQELLVLCYHSGQIEPAAWQQHLRDDPVLAAYCGQHKDRDPLH